jgi:hypothetical protein
MDEDVCERCWKMVKIDEMMYRVCFACLSSH